MLSRHWSLCCTRSPTPPSQTARTAPSPTQVVFRCDMLLLVGLVGLHLLTTRRITLPRAVLHGCAAVTISLAASVLVDSLFWRRWLWPEGEVLYFNTVLNKWVWGGRELALAGCTAWLSAG